MEKITAHRTTSKPCFLKPCHQLLWWQPKIYFYQKHLLHGSLRKGCNRNNVNGWKLLFIQLFSFGVCVNKKFNFLFFSCPSYLAVYITVVNPGSENNLKETQTFNSIQRKQKCHSRVLARGMTFPRVVYLVVDQSEAFLPSGQSDWSLFWRDRVPVFLESSTDSLSQRAVSLVARLHL